MGGGGGGEEGEGGGGRGEILIPNCPQNLRTGVLSAKPPVNGISRFENLSNFQKIKRDSFHENKYLQILILKVHRCFGNEVYNIVIERFP